MSTDRQDTLISSLAVKDALHVYSGNVDESEQERIISHRERHETYDEAYVVANQLLGAIDDYSEEWSLDAELMAFAEESGNTKPAYSRIIQKMFAVAAIVTLAVSAVLYVNSNWSGPGVDKSSIQRYVTRVGEQKVIELSDGSTITLNTGTQVLVDITDNERRIVLDRGEVYFDVEKDPIRPFTVELEGRSVTVLGTEFNVHRRLGMFSLALVDGSVCIHRQGESLSHKAIDLNPGQDEVLTYRPNDQFQVYAGTVVEFDTVGQQVVASRDQNIERFQQWRKGILSFKGERLSNVVDELNRYSAKRIELSDPSLNDLEVFASVKVGRIDLALKGMEITMPIVVVPFFDRIVVKPVEEN